MHSDGFGGYPFMSSIPRGQVFVDYMRTTRSAPSASISPPSTGTSPSGSLRRIDYTLEPQSQSVTKLPDIGNSTRQQRDKSFADGSHTRAIRTDHPDGSATIHAVRRSLPGADGLQAVNIREVTIAPDGTQKIRARVFHIPNGAAAPGIDGAAYAKQVFARDRTVLPEVPTVPDTAKDDLSAPQNEKTR